MVRYIKGDLLEMFGKGEFGAIAHGCNCFNLMGAGIARSISVKYGEALIADRYYTLPVGYQRLGNFSYALSGTPNGGTGTIVNLYTQLHPGRGFMENHFLSAMEKALHCFENIAIPYVGCGIGGYEKDGFPGLMERLDTRNKKVWVVDYEKTTT